MHIQIFAIAFVLIGTVLLVAGLLSYRISFVWPAILRPRDAKSFWVRYAFGNLVLLALAALAIIYAIDVFVEDSNILFGDD